MKTIFIVKSPLHLINAYEAKMHFDESDPEQLLILYTRSKGDEGLRRLKNAISYFKDCWPNIEIYNSRKRDYSVKIGSILPELVTYYKSMLWFKKLARKYNSVERLYLSHCFF